MDAAGIIAVIICCIFTVGMFISRQADKKEWNKGKCPDCNIAWDYQGLNIHIDFDNAKEYECPQCGNIIFISWYHRIWAVDKLPKPRAT